MGAFDPMAAAVDWLDAYRAGSLFIVDLYASDATAECRCGGMNVARGRFAISDYWLKRLNDHPAGELLELQPNGDAIAVSYRVPAGPVAAFAQTVVSSEYYVVRDATTKKCTIVDKKPTTTTTIVDNGVFKTRTEAETGMKTMKVCTEN